MNTVNLQISQTLTVIIQINQSRAMRIKQKYLKQKQFTDRPQASSRNTDSTPLLSRLEKQYLFNQQNPQKTSREYFVRGNKQNFANMVNSVPTDNNEYTSHNVIKIDNYEGKRFKTQQGYEPLMTKSRYMVDKEQAENGLQSAAVYKSSENIVLRRDKIRKMDQKIYDSIDLTENQRPLTFGLVRKTQPMKSSLEYKEDAKLKNQVLDEISSLRRSQQTLNCSKEYSVIDLENAARCVNHNNKKAKYRLLSQNKDQEDMIYCSKCAINLLQQGFKVEEIKAELPKKMMKSQHNLFQNHQMISSTGAPSRIQEMKNFQHKLNQVESKINQSLQESAMKTSQIEEIQRQMWQTESLYDQMTSHLQKMKETELSDLEQRKKKKIITLQRYQKQMGQELDNIKQMKIQMKQFKNKFVIMKQSQFQFLISSFLNKIHHYGNEYREGEVPVKKIEDQIDQIIIDLCEFCKKIKQVEESRLTRTQKNTQNSRHHASHQQSEDQFICKQIKGPFRTLFPDDSNQKQNNGNNHEGDSPTFKQKQTTMHKSIKGMELMKNQYY